MTVLSGQTIRRLGLVTPCLDRFTDPVSGMTWGLGPAGYDLRLDVGGGMQSWLMKCGEFTLVAAMEHFNMPSDVIGVVHDKSTLARRGLAVQNTVIEPGWRGYLTLELTNHGPEGITLWQGQPIAQVVFHLLDEPTVLPYSGRYQDQAAGPQGAR